MLRVFRPKILVIGHGRHGKDTVCEYLEEKHGLYHISSSLFCAEKVMMPYYESIGRPYDSVEECFKDRHSGDNRTIWYNVISEYNAEDPTRTARELLSEGYDIYCGMRSQRELDACVRASLFDSVWYVDASERVPLENSSSMSITDIGDAVVLDNNGDLCDLYTQIDRQILRMRLCDAKT